MMKLLKSDYHFQTDNGEIVVSMVMANKHRSVCVYPKSGPEESVMYWDTTLPIRPATAVKFLIKYLDAMKFKK